MENSKLTITEALQDIKTCAKKIEKKREFVLAHLLRPSAMVDPLTNSPEQIQSSLQAISDLNVRIVSLRRAISDANAVTPVTVQDDTRTIAEWLVWKQEISKGHLAFLNQMQTNIRQARQQFVQRQKVQTGPSQDQPPIDLIVHLDEKRLAQLIENVEVVLSELDGQLSLKNATVFVEVTR